jgi:two-component system cell cycle sensor histidine kinase/response regulator CckA
MATEKCRNIGAAGGNEMSDSRKKGEVESRGDASDRAELHRVFFEEAADGMFIADPRGRYVAVNPRGTELTGYSREELLNMTISSLIPQEDLDRDPFKIEDLREGRIVVNERSIRRKDGNLVPVEISARMLPDGNLLGIVRDITKRKAAEDALRQSEERFRLTFETSPDSININRLEDGMYVDINEGFTRITGFEREDVIGKTSLAVNIWHDPKDREELVRGLRQNGFYSDLEAKFRRKDGSLAYGQMSARVIMLQGVPHIISVTRDITERKQAEADKERLRAQLVHAQKMESVGRLAGGVAHDFNNMLGVILGHTELATMQVDPAQPIHANLKEIHKAAQRSADLTRQLLAFARKQTVAPKVLDLNTTVGDMFKMLQRLIGEDIDLLWKPKEALWPARIDPAQVDQILVNLSVNARDAIARVGKITIETDNITFDETYCAAHLGSVSGEYVMLAVSDDGCGMNKEILEHLFEPFFTTKGAGQGTGLGLATVYGIVKQNEGFINVYSEPNQGTTVKIYLPRFAGEALESVGAGAAQTPRGHGETILLLEDEAAILDIGKAMLELLGYTVLTAGRPGEALRQAEAHTGEIHLLITDVVMPEMNGRDLAAQLSAIKPGLKCLFMSGYTANVIVHHGILDEDIQFLQKPFSFHGLATKVREVLERA